MSKKSEIIYLCGQALCYTFPHQCFQLVKETQMLESGSMSNLLEELRLSCMWIVNVIGLDTSSEVKEPRGDSQCKEEGVGQESRRVRQIPVRRCGLADGIRRRN